MTTSTDVSSRQPGTQPAETHPERLPYPVGVTPRKILWPYAISITVYHLLALLAFVPWLFSWSGVVLAWLGLYVFGTLGINLCYHRLLTHQGLKVPRWLEYTLAVLGVCCMQDTPARWVAIHRKHHQHSDEPPDPHSPLVTFLWGHVVWLLVENREVNNVATYEKYARDILRDRFYFALEKHLLWLWINVAHGALFYLAGLSIGWATTGMYSEGVRFGLSLLVWGVFVRTVAVWHITWSVNSVTHMWGYRNYDTDENSQNNWLVGILSNGEGWHNNHHAEPRCVAHGHRWWELDVTYRTIRFLQLVGLARDVVMPSQKLLKKLAAEKVMATEKGW